MADGNCPACGVFFESRNTVHARLLAAARRGRGIRLTNAEVERLLQDEAVEKRAINDLDYCEDCGDD